MKKLKELFKKYNEIIRYGIVGVLTTVVSLLVKWGLLFTCLDAKNDLQLQIVVIISWVVAVLFAYVTNRTYVFKSSNQNVIKEMISFFGSRVVTLLLEMLIMWFMVSFLLLNSDLWVLISTLIVQVVVIVGNYILSKIFVFKKN